MKYLQWTLVSVVIGSFAQGGQIGDQIRWIADQICPAFLRMAAPRARGIQIGGLEGAISNERLEAEKQIEEYQAQMENEFPGLLGRMRDACSKAGFYIGLDAPSNGGNPYLVIMETIDFFANTLELERCSRLVSEGKSYEYKARIDKAVNGAVLTLFRSGQDMAYAYDFANHRVRSPAVLARLPLVPANLKKIFWEKLQQSIEKDIERWTRLKGGPSSSPTTVTNYILRLSAFREWVVKQQEIQ